MKGAYCKICRRTVTPADAVTMAAFGRRLFVVHRSPCADAVQQGMRVATAAALTGVKAVLTTRAPRALMLLEQGARIRQRLREVHSA